MEENIRNKAQDLDRIWNNLSLNYWERDEIDTMLCAFTAAGCLQCKLSWDWIYLTINGFAWSIILRIKM